MANLFNRRNTLRTNRFFPLLRSYPNNSIEDSVISFIECLPSIRKEGKEVGDKVKLFAFQKEIISNILQPTIRQAIVSIPRKCGKSFIAIWLLLAYLLCKPLLRKSAQLLCISVTTRQADNILNAMVDIIDQLLPIDKQDLVIRQDIKLITNTATGTRFKILAADKTGAKLQGYEATFAVIDEAASFVSPLTYQSMKTSNPHKLLLISTQCHFPEAENHYFTKLLEDEDLPKHTYRYFLGANRTQVAGDSWKDKELWKQVTPSFEIKPMSYLEQEAIDAEKFNSINTFKTFHLNSLVTTLSDEVGIASDDDLQKCFDKKARIQNKEKVVIGLDLSEVTDLTAIVCLSLNSITESHFFIPLNTANANTNIPYEQWHKEKFATICKTKTVDFYQVVEKIKEYQNKYEVIAIAHDAWLINQFKFVANEAGIAERIFCKVAQYGKEISKGTKYIQRLIVDGKLKINNPCLRWNLACCRWSQDTLGNLRPHKQLSHKLKGHRIDGLLALINACYYVSENNLAMNKKKFIFNWIESPESKV